MRCIVFAIDFRLKIHLLLHFIVILLSVGNFFLLLSYNYKKQCKMMKKGFLLLAVMLCCATQEIFAQLPAVVLNTIEGKAVKTDTLSNDGKPFIIDFFAT